MNKPILELKNITKTFQQGDARIEVLKNIDFAVMPKEMVAIIGNSGSGKSTLLQIAGLLDRPDSGTLKIAEEGIKFNHDGNVESSAPNYDYLRLKYFGFIYQYHHLLKDFSARENVAMPSVISGGNYREALAEADKLLEILGLKNRRYNMPGELSGGEQQRVAIGRALINKPKVILADEPTGNLDPNSATDVFNLFLEVSKIHATSIIMVTHNHNLADKMHQIYQLNEGCIKSLGAQVKG